MIKILYLEDNNFDIDLTLLEISKALPNSTVMVARTIQELNTLISDNPDYEVAILDLNLPDGNGIDALMAIRQQQLPMAVIILTGSGNEEAAIAALKAGADDYLTKSEGYLKKLPDIILTAIDNFKKNLEKYLKPLKVLYVEWNKPDIEFTERHMRKYAPYIQLQNVLTSDEALQLLPQTNIEVCPFDILLLDYRLPGLNAIDTIQIIRQERKLSIPIVLVTGHGNEDVAVQSLKIGANEYLVKRENYLFRLPSLLTNAYQHYELEKQQVALRESEAKYRLLAENASDVIFTFDMNLNYKYVSPAVKELRGYEVEEVMKQRIHDILTSQSIETVSQLVAKIIPDKTKPVTGEVPPQIVELEMIRKDGSTVWTEVKITLLTDENKVPTGFQGVTRDISKRKAALEELYRSREEYKSFFEDDLTGDFISHVDGYLINCNSAYLKMLGFDSLEEAKSYLAERIHVSKEFRNAMLDRLRKEKKLIWFEHNLIRKDGKIINAIANIIGGFNKDGELETLKGYIIDDTERKKATDEIRKLSRAMEQSPASVVITDLMGNIEYVNPIFTEITGYTFEEVKGKNPRILNSGNMHKSIYSELWGTITNGKNWSGELENKRKDGSLLWEYVSISPIKNTNGETTHYLAVKEDITSKKKYEEELIIARDQAQESNRLKSAFLATMSHELRTPLNAIIGFSDLMSEKMEKSEIIRFAKTINNSGNHLLNIIEDIFTVSLLQTKQSKIVTEEFKLSEFVKGLVQYATVELNTKNKKTIQIKSDPKILNSDLKIRSDKTKIFQVLINFIKNAVEYTDKGEIEINLTITENDITFFVRDTGIGIPTDKIEIIFEQFRQLDDSHTRIHDGIGLGLAICSEIQKLLNGKIWVESEVGVGSVFYFSLHQVVKNEKPIHKKIENKTEVPVLTHKNILIVEDEETNYWLLKTYVKRTNANVIWAKSGEESVEICRNNPNIDLVFMDIRMPGIDGIEAANQIKAFSPGLKIIAQTAFAFEQDRDRILNSGCDGYISKPIDTNILMEILNNHFNPHVSK